MDGREGCGSRDARAVKSRLPGPGAASWSKLFCVPARGRLLGRELLSHKLARTQLPRRNHAADLTGSLAVLLSACSVVILTSVRGRTLGNFVRHELLGTKHFDRRSGRPASRLLELWSSRPRASGRASGHSRRAVLDHHLHHHHPANMDLHPGFHELDRHHERDHPVRLYPALVELRADLP